MSRRILICTATLVVAGVAALAPAASADPSTSSEHVITSHGTGAFAPQRTGGREAPRLEPAASGFDWGSAAIGAGAGAGALAMLSLGATPIGWRRGLPPARR